MNYFNNTKLTTSKEPLFILYGKPKAIELGHSHAWKTFLPCKYHILPWNSAKLLIPVLINQLTDTSNNNSITTEALHQARGLGRASSFLCEQVVCAGEKGIKPHPIISCFLSNAWSSSVVFQSLIFTSTSCDPVYLTAHRSLSAMTDSSHGS